MKNKPGPKNIPWRTVSEQDWAEGCAHVARLMGVSTTAAWLARRRLDAGPPARKAPRPVPEGLHPMDSPKAVARRHGVCIPTARKWLQALGRPPGKRAGTADTPAE